MKLNYDKVKRAMEFPEGSLEVAGNDVTYNKGDKIKIFTDDGMWTPATVVSFKGSNLRIDYGPEYEAETVDIRKYKIKKGGSTKSAGNASKKSAVPSPNPLKRGDVLSIRQDGVWMVGVVVSDKDGKVTVTLGESKKRAVLERGIDAMTQHKDWATANKTSYHKNLKDRAGSRDVIANDLNSKGLNPSAADNKKAYDRITARKAHISGMGKKRRPTGEYSLLKGDEVTFDGTRETVSSAKEGKVTFKSGKKVDFNKFFNTDSSTRHVNHSMEKDVETFNLKHFSSNFAKSPAAFSKSSAFAGIGREALTKVVKVISDAIVHYEIPAVGKALDAAKEALTKF